MPINKVAAAEFGNISNRHRKNIHLLYLGLVKSVLACICSELTLLGRGVNVPLVKCWLGIGRMKAFQQAQQELDCL